MGAAPPPTPGRGFALIAFGIYSTHDVVVKVLGAAYSPFQIVFFSTLFGFPIVAVMLMHDPVDGNLRPRHPWWTLLRTAASVVTTASAFYAFSALPMAQTYAIIFAAPLLITILAIPILGENVGWRRWLAVAAGLVGVIVVLQPGADRLLGGASRGARRGGLLGGRGGGGAQDRRRGAQRGAAALPDDGELRADGLRAALRLSADAGLHLGGAATIALLGFGGAICHIAAYRSGSAVVVAPMQYSQILWATLYGFAFFGEAPDRNTAIGAGIIIASGVYVVFREERPHVSKTRPVSRTQSRYVIGTYPRISILRRLFRKSV